MKLLMCLECNDVFNIIHIERSCYCGESKGKYIDKANAIIEGNCMPLGLANSSLLKAVGIQLLENKYKSDETCCKGVEFNAFTIPDWAKTIKRR